MQDIETGARAAFEALHAKDNRRRNWDRHPDEDSGAEMGRNTFRHMVAAVLGLGAEPEPAVDYTYSAMEPGAGLVPTGVAGVAETETLPASASQTLGGQHSGQITNLPMGGSMPPPALPDDQSPERQQPEHPDAA